MEKEQFQYLVSEVRSWIADTLADYKTQMEPIAKVRFKRLKEYYPRTLLERIQRVIVDRCPVPPLEWTGISQLGEIEAWDIKGIPWANTIFIRRDLANWEAIHFHELVHIIQWEHLGAERYLTAWAIGTITLGYRENPLEEMAFRHQARFEEDGKPFDIVSEVSKEISNLPESVFDIKRI